MMSSLAICCFRREGLEIGSAVFEIWLRPTLENTLAIVIARQSCEVTRFQQECLEKS